MPEGHQHALMESCGVFFLFFVCLFVVVVVVFVVVVCLGFFFFFFGGGGDREPYCPLDPLLYIHLPNLLLVFYVLS